MTWNQLQRLTIPWLETLARPLGRVTMPDIHGRSLWVLSDYSFDNRASDFDVVGFLVADPDAFADWKCLRSEVRAKLLPDGRRMSWKKLNSDSLRKAAFLPFLRAADRICGLSVALAFHRDPVFQIPEDDLDRFAQAFHPSADLKPRHLQQMFRIAYCTAMVLAGLSRPGQDVHWVSDQDAVFDTEPREIDTVGVFSKLLNVYSPHDMGQVRYGTTAYGAEPLFQEDLAAVPDLICGAASEILTTIKREYTDMPDIYSALPELANRPRQFLNWYASGPWPLKRYICSFEGPKGSTSIGGHPRPHSPGTISDRELSAVPALFSAEWGH